MNTSNEVKESKFSTDTTVKFSNDNDKKGGYDLFLYTRAFAAGSIASSCCLIQLGINLLSYLNIVHVGCAGFNKTLGPLRPYTRSLTVAWLVWNWMPTFAVKSMQSAKKDRPRLKDSNCCRRTSKKKLLLSTLLCLILMFMPEFLEVIGDFNTASELLAASKASSSSEDRQFKKMEYVVDNMGCEACVNAVEGIIMRHKSIATCKITSFDFGKVDIYVDTDMLRLGQQQVIERELDDLLRVDGYELHEEGWTTKKMEMEMKRKHTSAFA